MNKYGFFIKRLELSGSSVETKIIQFEKGLNVIFGSSDTGKTFIFQCINYMLGGTTPPKYIPESENYNLLGLLIETCGGKTYKLERSLKGGNFNLFDENDVLLKDLNEVNDKRVDKETISSFLLEICNMSNKEIRKNQSGAKQNLYFQDIHKYFLII